jgi:membrane protein implicated in regulation of membrane protease activity
MWVLIAGVVILALELVSGSFYLLWYGIGLCLAGAVGWAIGDEHTLVQAAIGVAIGIVTMVLFRKRIVGRMMGHKTRDEFLLEEGQGIIREGGLVEFRGTTWQYDVAGGESYEIGERVIVTPAKSNRVHIRKIVK